MTHHALTFQKAKLEARASGALWWSDHQLLAVSDLHIGTAAAQASLGESWIPPFEITDTLLRLENEIHATGAQTIICLGNNFNDMRAEDHLPDGIQIWLSRLMAGRQWVWIEGAHGIGPVSLGGSNQADWQQDGIRFCSTLTGDKGEIAGGHGPKMRLPTGNSRSCFLIDETKIILPAFGTMASGINAQKPPLRELMAAKAQAVVTGGHALLMEL